MPTPPRIFQFWAGGRVPSRYLRFIDSVKRHNPECEHRLLREEDAERLSDMTWERLKKEYATYCSISNLVRLLAVFRHGGVWLDMDCECVRPLAPLLVHEAFAAVVDQVSVQGSPNRICCAVFGAVPQHPWLRWQIENRKRFDLRDSEWGVPLMSVAPRDGLTLVPTATFFPWTWDSKAEEQTVKPETVICHHWDGDWRACT